MDRDRRSRSRDRDNKERSARIASGICFDWQKGRCTRGSSCKFNHDGDKEKGKNY